MSTTQQGHGNDGSKQDCRDVQGLIERTFGPEDAPLATIVYVGDRAEYS